MHALSERAKQNLLCVFLLLLLGLVAITAARAFQAVHNFQQQYSEIKAEDVNAIHPWMTIHVISHVYHIPENYLYRSLTLDNPAQLRHATLYQIATLKRQSINQIVHTAQHAILSYRKHRSSFVLHSSQKEPLLQTPGRITY